MNRKSCFALFLIAAPLTSAPLASAGEARPTDQTLLDDRAEKSIFNGTDLTGWTGDPRLWSVKEGAITGQTTPENPAKGNTFLIWTNGEVGDFELRCSFKLTADRKSVV